MRQMWISRKSQKGGVEERKCGGRGGGGRWKGCLLYTSALNSAIGKKVRICEMRREWDHSRHGSVFDRFVPEPTGV